MTTFVRRRLAAICLALITAGPAWADDTNTQAAATASPAVTQANAGAIGVISGSVGGTYLRIASDMAANLDEAGRLRVLPIVGRGSVQNMSDLMYLHGVDVAIVQADVLAYLDRSQPHAGLHQTVQYIAKLYDEELHVLARGDIADMAALTGKPVNVDDVGSGTSITASVVFDALGLKPQLRHDSQAEALEKLRHGEIAAMIYVAGKPASVFSNLDSNTSGLHFLSVTATPALMDAYLPARLDHAQYPALIAEGAPVNTLAVGAVMAVYAWPRNSARYESVARFADTLFKNIGKFRKAPNHPKWADINLSATLPGWTRFPAAEEALRRTAASNGGKLALD